MFSSAFISFFVSSFTLQSSPIMNAFTSLSCSCTKLPLCEFFSLGCFDTFRLFLGLARIIFEDRNYRIYIGCGTSGRLAALDAVELQCTFGLPHHQAVAYISGGSAEAAMSIEHLFVGFFVAFFFVIIFSNSNPCQFVSCFFDLIAVSIYHVSRREHVCCTFFLSYLFVSFLGPEMAAGHSPHSSFRIFSQRIASASIQV